MKRTLFITLALILTLTSNIFSQINVESKLLNNGKTEYIISAIDDNIVYNTSVLIITPNKYNSFLKSINKARGEYLILKQKSSLSKNPISKSLDIYTRSIKACHFMDIDNYVDFKYYFSNNILYIYTEELEFTHYNLEQDFQNFNFIGDVLICDDSYFGEEIRMEGIILTFKTIQEIDNFINQITK